MKFLKLTDANNGKPVYIASDKIVSVGSYPVPYHTNIHCLATNGKEHHYIVRESVDDVMYILQKIYYLENSFVGQGIGIVDPRRSMFIIDKEEAEKKYADSKEV